MKTLYFAAMLLSSHVMLAYDCRVLTKEELLNQADVVFLGFILEVRDSTVLISTVEIFKGDAGGDIEWALAPGQSKPRKGSTWLVYGRLKSHGVIYVDICSGTKCFDAPYNYHNWSAPSPPGADLLSLSRDSKVIYEQMLLDRAQIEFYSDIQALRTKAIEDELDRINLRLQQVELNGKEYWRMVVYALAGSLALLLLLLAYISRKRT